MSFINSKDSVCPELCSLNISCCNLSKISKIFFSMNHLTELNLSNNNLRSLPYEIGNLHNLLILDISGNKLTSLPNSVKFIHNLNLLDISCNNFYDVPHALYSGLGVLKTLNLSFNRIRSFDYAPKCINTLRILKLTCNGLVDLPKWVLHSLCQLIDLDIGGNCIFPSIEINDFCTARVFESLQFLNVENCNLSSEKIKYLSHFKNLEFLYAGNKKHKNVEKFQNYLGNLKIDALKNLKALKCLYMQNVQISTLSVDFDCMKNLEILDLSDNLLSWLPDCLCDLILLKILNLMSNQLIFLPSSINKLINLKELHLGNNNLYFLPEGIYNLSNLEYVDFYNNKIKEIDFIFFKNKNLRGIDLGMNCLHNYFFHPDNEAINAQYEFLKNSFRIRFNYLDIRCDVQLLRTPTEEGSCSPQNWDYFNLSESVSDSEDLSAVAAQVPCQEVFKEENWEDDVEVLNEDDLFNPNEVQVRRQFHSSNNEWSSEFPNNYCPASSSVPSFRETYVRNVESSLNKNSVEGQFDSD